MANSGLAQRQTQPNNAYHCKECSMYFDSMKSLDVHLHYHKENLLSKWATQASFNEESNNNNTHKNGNNAKGHNKNNHHHHDYKSTIAAPADSSDTSSGGGGGGMMKKCVPLAPTALPSRTQQPSYRTSPPSNGVPYSQGNYNNPAAYQGDPQRFSPANGHQMFAYQNGMPNRTPPPSFQPFGQQNYVMRPAESNQQNSFYDGNNLIQQNYPNNGEPFSNSLSMSSSTPSSVSSPSPSSTAPNTTTGFRYHPYQHNSSTYAGDRGGVVSSSSYAPRPTSPQQCDKCGTICDTRDALGEHLSMAHPPTPVGQQYQPPPSQQQQQQQQRNGNNGFSSARVKEEAFDPFHSEVDIKQEDEPQAEILDLDSHKVHVYQPPEEEEVALRGPGGNPHSVSAMLWGSSNHSSPPEPSPKPYQNMHSPPERKPYHQQQLGRNPTPDYVTSTLTSPQPDLVPQQAYQQQQQQQQRYLQVPDQPQPGIQPQQPITSSQVPNNTPSLPTQPNSPQLPPQPTTGKGNSWKSNEARRPKTYNCSACNKWFTSSGHLKRHYNTTLHKNAVKQSGQPDPSTFPINTHHHPHRDPNYVPRGRRDEADTIISPVSSLGNEDSSRSDEYGRITPGGQHNSMLLPPPMNGGLMSNGGGVVHNPMIASPPNRLAGPPDYPHSGGLRSMMTSPSHNANYIHETRHTMEPISVHRQPPPHQIMRHSPSPSAMMHHPSPQDMMQHHNSPPEMMHLHSPSDMIHHPTSEMMHISAGGPPELMRRPSPTHMMQHHTSPPHLVHHPQPHPVALLTSAQMEQQMMQNYPNALPPHVTTNLTPLQTIHTNTNQITSTGNPENDNNTQQLLSLGSANLEELQPMQHYFGSLNGNMFHMPIQQALPSFAQFGHQGAGGYPPGQTLTMLQNMGGMVGAPNYMVHAAEHNVGGLMHPSPNNINNQQHHYLLMESYQPNNAINNNNNNYIAEEVDNVTSLNGDRFNSDSNTSLGESLLSPVGTPDCPTSTKSDFEHVVIKMEDSDPGNKEDNLTVSSTNEINIYSSNSISNGTLHKCIDCDKVFNKACYLTQHNKSFHSGLKPFKCHRCGKRFPAEYLYEEHLTKHAGDKPYKCEICPKQFNHKTDLRRHMCLHTGEKPYACEICGKGFIRKDHMLKHCITHRRKLNIQQQQQHIIAQ